MTTYHKHVGEPWFSLIKLKQKNVEGRLNKGDFANMKIGDIIVFENNDFDPPRQVKVKVTQINKYDSFRKYLQAERLRNCLPGMTTIKSGENVYYKYFTPEQEKEFGVAAILFSHDI